MADLKKTDKPKINPSEIILQWLTYAFWAWTAASATALSTTIFANYIAKNIDSTQIGAYLLASLIVLLPISIICDYFYKKHEPTKKHGPAGLVMIVHTVLFALIAIGGLITAVFALVSILLTGNDSSDGKITLLTSLVASMLFSLLLIRVLRIQKIKFLEKKFSWIMIFIGLILAVFAIIGPINTFKITRNDRLIRDNLATVQNEISNYANTNQKLPDDLSQLDLRGDAKKLVDKNLLKYTANTKPSELNKTIAPETGASTTSKAMLAPDYYPDGSKSLFYEICVTFKRDSSIPTNYPIAEPAIYSTGTSQQTDDYKTYYDFYNYKAGEKCYKTRVIIYSSGTVKPL